MHRPEAKLFPRKFRVILRKLFDPDELVLVHIGEVLARIGGGPPDFQSHNLRRFSQTDVLLDRTGAKGTSTADGAINRARAVSFIFCGHVDARSDSRAIRLRSEEHTSELQSRLHLVCRLLLEKKKNKHKTSSHTQEGAVT